MDSYYINKFNISLFDTNLNNKISNNLIDADLNKYNY